MAKLVLTDSRITLGGTDISSYVAAVTVSSTAAEVETTAFGSTAVTRVGGLRDNSVTLSIHQDFPTIENLVYPLIGSTATIVIRPDGTTTSSTNQSYTGSVLVTEWTPVNGAVGELNTADVTWPINGAWTRGTA